MRRGRASRGRPAPVGIGTWSTSRPQRARQRRRTACTPGSGAPPPSPGRQVLDGEPERLDHVRRPGGPGRSVRPSRSAGAASRRTARAAPDRSCGRQVAGQAAVDGVVQRRGDRRCGAEVGLGDPGGDVPAGPGPLEAASGAQGRWVVDEPVRGMAQSAAGRSAAQGHERPDGDAPRDAGGALVHPGEFGRSARDGACGSRSGGVTVVQVSEKGKPIARWGRKANGTHVVGRAAER